MNFGGISEQCSSLQAHAPRAPIGRHNGASVVGARVPLGNSELAASN